MGVKGLWTLLSASGRCIPLDALTSRVLAIDVSLWLFQFLKAMRSEDGQARQDAHLIGMFKRICRLLLFGIRPIFVYDGPPPVLKRKTLALRRRLRESSELRWQRTAEKILLTQLKLKTIHELKKQLEGSANAPVDPEELKEIADSIESERVNQATKDEFADLFKTDEEEDGDEAAFADGDTIHRREIIVPENIDVMDPEALAALPYSMQFEVLEKLREDRAHESRVRHIASANAPSTFSSTQLNQFLETSTFNRKINEVRSRVGGSSIDRASQGIATMPDTLFYFCKTPTIRKSGKRERQELLRAAKHDEKPKITLSDYHMESWMCLQCGLSNLAIRRSCQKCGHGYGQSVGNWNCPVCLAVNPEQNSHCSSCHQVRRSAEQHSAPEVLDRTSEIDALFDDTSFDSQAEITTEGPCVEKGSALQEVSCVETDPENCAGVNESVSNELLSIRNSRLNFYRLQRKSSITYSQEEASRFGASDKVNPSRQDPNRFPAASTPPISSGDNDIRESAAVVAINPNTPGDILSDQSDFDSRSTEVIEGADAVFDHESLSSSGHDEIGEILPQCDMNECGFGSPSKNLSSPVPTFERPLLSHSVENRNSLEQPSSKVEFSSSPAAPHMPHFVSITGPDNLPVTGQAAPVSIQSPSPLAESQLKDPISSLPLIPSQTPVCGRHSMDMISSQPVRDPSQISPLSIDIDETRAIDDLADLRSSQIRNLRDADHVTDEMIQETQILLRLFGVPFVRAPAEAEAQCAALELLGLVDGVVTDDSDVFLFGARNVYRNMFSSDKTVERYQMSDIEPELGIDREKLIQMALLLGSDYTDGIHGIGIVNATEIVNSFEDLKEFREWVYSDDVMRSETTNSQEEDERLARLRKFKYAHRNVRRNWQVPRDFPDEQVMITYLKPLIDKSEEKFSWSKPDVIKLKQFCHDHLQWKFDKTEGLLAPVINKLQDSSYQTRLEAFFGSGEKAARIRSKRMKLAVNDLTSSSR